MMLPITPEVLIAELGSTKDIVAKWLAEVINGIPCVTLPGGTEDQLEDYLRALCGELLLVAGKCTTLAEVLYASRS